MKVAFLVGVLSDASGGIAVSVPTVIKRLATETNIEPHVIGVYDSKNEAAAAHWGPNVHGHTARGPISFLWAPEMSHTVDNLNPDIIDTHALWLNLSRVALAQRRKKGTPLVITPHGMMDPWALKRSAWKKRFAGWWFEDEHIRSARVFRALNEDEARAIRSYGATAPIAIVPNGIEPPPPSRLTTAGDRPPVIQFLGRLDPKKGLEPLLHAWALVQQHHSAADWRLQVNGWGDPSYIAALQRLASELALGGSLSLGGPAFGAEKDVALGLAAGLVLPSYSEGMPMAVLEAWSWGTPVLMTRACNLPEGFSTGAALEIETEPKRLAQGLLDFMSMRSDERQAIGANGRRLVEDKFGARQVAQSLDRLYAWVAGGGAAPSDLLIQ